MNQQKTTKNERNEYRRQQPARYDTRTQRTYKTHKNLVRTYNILMAIISSITTDWTGPQKMTPQ